MLGTTYYNNIHRTYYYYNLYVYYVYNDVVIVMLEYENNFYIDINLNFDFINYTLPKIILKMYLVFCLQRSESETI